MHSYPLPTHTLNPTIFTCNARLRAIMNAKTEACTLHHMRYRDSVSQQYTSNPSLTAATLLHRLLSLAPGYTLQTMQHTPPIPKHHRQVFQGELPIMLTGRTIHVVLTRHHHQGGLVRLPAEVRAVIYKHLLAGGAAGPITLVKGKSFRTIGLPGASLLRTCRLIFNELNPTVAALRNAATLDIRVVDTMAMPRAPRPLRDLNLKGARKVDVKVMLSQLTERAIVLRGLSSLISPIAKCSNIQELSVTVSATRSYTD